VSIREFFKIIPCVYLTVAENKNKKRRRWWWGEEYKKNKTEKVGRRENKVITYS